MKILFQGSWREDRDLKQNKELIGKYCKVLAKFIVDYNFTIVLTSFDGYENFIAKEIASIVKNSAEKLKEHILFLLPGRIREIPEIGTVHKIANTNYWQDERTYLVQQSDAVIAIGGGKGTSDCIQKGILANKPVFVAEQIQGKPTDAWRTRPISYKYFSNGDTRFTEDLNTTPEFFFKHVFDVLKRKLEIDVYSRNIFVVHGRDHYEREKLVNILTKLDFNPIVLEKESNNGLTIIEKLEREINNVGFGFILYTADDMGRIKDGNEKSRVRQNVIFEHGYLFGLLGRNRTCALVKDDVEFPSDLDGVISNRIADLNNESITIAKILKEAGYKVDASKLL